MASSTATSVNHADKPVKAPPDERFWKKYSPRYELPISGATSFVAHALVLTLLVLAGAIAASLGLAPDKPPEGGAIVIAGGGGNPHGVGTNKNTGILPDGQEAAKPDQEPKITGDPKAPPELEKVEPTPPELVKPDKEDTSQRVINKSQQALGVLSQVGKNARDRLDGMIAGKGRGGSGSGGGQGAGEGKGVGDLKGQGQGRFEKRQKRQLRWTMIFNTKDGPDYLRQLHSLGAVVAVPGPDNQYQVIRNLMKRPVEMKHEEVAGLDRIYWVDDRPQSVESFVLALGLTFKPDHLAAFFPPEMEQELLTKELDHLRKGAAGRRKTEDDILETRFQVISRGGRYVPMVVSQQVR